MGFRLVFVAALFLSLCRRASVGPLRWLHDTILFIHAYTLFCLYMTLSLFPRASAAMPLASLVRGCGHLCRLVICWGVALYFGHLPIASAATCFTSFVIGSRGRSFYARESSGRRPRASVALGASLITCLLTSAAASVTSLVGGHSL